MSKITLEDNRDNFRMLFENLEDNDLFEVGDGILRVKCHPFFVREDLCYEFNSRTLASNMPTRVMSMAKVTKINRIKFTILE